eukprot:1137333-Pelagomonas_calceolata.AAC.1
MAEETSFMALRQRQALNAKPAMSSIPCSGIILVSLYREDRLGRSGTFSHTSTCFYQNNRLDQSGTFSHTSTCFSGNLSTTDIHRLTGPTWLKASIHPPQEVSWNENGKKEKAAAHLQATLGCLLHLQLGKWQRGSLDLQVHARVHAL